MGKGTNLNWWSPDCWGPHWRPPMGSTAGWTAQAAKSWDLNQTTLKRNLFVKKTKRLQLLGNYDVLLDKITVKAINIILKLYTYIYIIYIYTVYTSPKPPQHPKKKKHHADEFTLNIPSLGHPRLIGTRAFQLIGKDVVLHGTPCEPWKSEGLKHLLKVGTYQNQL